MKIKAKAPSNLPKGNAKLLYGTRRSFHSQSGQSMLEMALLTPILLVLLIGVIEMGRYAYMSILAGNAAEAGALFGAASLSNSGNAPAIQSAAQNDGQNVSGLTITSTPVCGCDTSGAFVAGSCTAPPTPPCTAGAHWVVNVQVTATGAFTGLFTYPGIPHTLTVIRTVTMHVKDA